MKGFLVHFNRYNDQFLIFNRNKSTKLPQHLKKANFARTYPFINHNYKSMSEESIKLDLACFYTKWIDK